LWVEDLPANQVITATMLQRESHLLHVARSGAEAIAMVQQTAYDVVLMDISMPGMSGLQAAQKIRALPAPMRHLPIIAVTANSSGDDMAACLAAGMVDMLAKPVSTDMLQAALLRHVWLPQRPSPTVAPAAMTPSVSGLDLDRIDGLRAGLTDTAFSAVVDACLADLQQLIPALRMALIEGKLSEIMRLAHAIAGVAGTYGLVDVQRRVEQMEQAARRGDHASVQKWSNQLEDETERSIEAMRAYVLVQAA
jgi:CheY-like chemotaxis protein